MSDETTPAETWTAVGATLVHADRIVGSLSTSELAEWVAEACETLAEMDKAQAEWEASGEAAQCSMVDIGGEQMRVQGGAGMPEPLRDAMADVVSAVRLAKANERSEVERLVRELEAAEAAVARVRAVLDQKGSDLDKVELTSPLPIRRRVRISEIRAALDQPGEPT